MMMLQPLRGLRDTVVNCFEFANARPWIHDFLYPLIGEQSVFKYTTFYLRVHLVNLCLDIHCLGNS
jgi:hypothetical protein